LKIGTSEMPYASETTNSISGCQFTPTPTYLLQEAPVI
jgi:hypothetical protein